MTWLRLARATIVDHLAAKLDVPVLGYEPRGDDVGGTFVTVRVSSVDPHEADLEIRAVTELRADRTQQDALDDLVDAVDLNVPDGVFLRSWSFDFDDDRGAVVATGTFYTRRYSGWCDPTLNTP